MSSFLGNLLGGENQSQVTDMIQQILEQNGGVGGLLSRFEQSGLGGLADSWVNPSQQNHPLSPQHIDQTFSQDEIEGWAQQAGTSPDMMRQVLAQAIPHVVDHATPGGEVPEQNASIDWGGLVSRFLGSR